MKKDQYFSGLTRNTFFLAFTSFFADISTEMLYPILPVFLTQVLGANAGVVGIVEGVAVATQNIVQGFSGWISDALHKHKRVAILGYSLAALSKPLFGFAASWQWVLGTRFLDRFGTGVRSAPRDALIAASTDEKHRGKAFGLEGVGDNLGAFVGPLIAICLLYLLRLQMRDIFYIAFIPGVLAVVMIVLTREKIAAQKQPVLPKVSLSNFPVIYWKYLLVTALFCLGNISTSFLILRSRNDGIPLVITILIYACFNLVAAIVSYPAGYLSDIFGRKYVLLAACVVFIITTLGFAVSHNLYLIGCLFVLYGAFQGIFRAAGKALATDFVPVGLRASGIGWYSTTVGIFSLFASLIGGQLWVFFSPATTFYYGAIFGILGSVALFLLIPHKTHKQ